MVKIVTIGDIHWRSLARHQEYTRAFKILFEELREIKPDLIINLGDVYHTKTAGITPEIIEKLAWMFNELAAIAPSVTILGNHDCFTGEHEVLTRNGWKTFINLDKTRDEEVATFNSATNEIEFQMPNQWINNFVSQNLLHISGKEIDVTVTNTHEFLYSFWDKNKYQKCDAQNLPKFATIPINGVVKEHKENISAALLGFALADGTFVLKSERTGACRIQFKLKKERKLRYLKYLLDSIGYETKFRSQKDGTTVVCIYEELAKTIYKFFDGKKEIPTNIYQKDNHFLKSFLSGYLSGDGNNMLNNSWRYFSISKNNRDALVTIARLVGGSSHSSNKIIFGNYENSKQQYGGVCNLNDKVNFTGISQKVIVPFTGNVYCVSVPNGNLLVRRNNKICITGNCNLTNLDRQDVISPIHNAINNPNSYLLKQSISKTFDINGKKIALHPYSPTDKEHWDNLKPIEGCINIALFHGPVTGCLTDLGWDMGEGEKDVSFFEPYDFAFLGDIHKQQYLGYRNDINGISKPWIGYGGSIIQQNHGEDIKKGYYVWDIRDKNDWDVEWKKLINLSPFVTLNWAGSVEQTLENFEKLHGNYAYMAETKYRIVSDVLIPQVQTKQFIELLKKQHKATEVIFKTDLVSNMETVNAHGIEINKKSLSQDPATMTKLYEKYMESNKDLFRITTEEQAEDAIDAAEIIKDYCQKLYTAEKDNTEARNVQWSIKEFKFDNIFGYGEGNTINFENLHNIVGILGNNRVGKSSLVGSLMYTLYNTTDRGSIKNSLVINTNKNYCFGSVRINVSGDEYLIERKTTRSPSKKGIEDDKAVTSLNLWLIENRDGQEVKISKNGITRDDTDKNIRNLIGNSDDFLLTAFASQNNINRFIENKATKRKEILNRFLELDIFEKLFLYAKNDYQNLDNQSKNYTAKDWAKLIERTEKEIEKYKEDIISIDDKIIVCNNKRDQLNLWIKSHENTAKAIDTTSIASIETQINAFKNQTDIIEERIKGNKTKLKEKQKEKATIEKSIENIDIKVLEKDLDSFESLKDNFNNLQKEYDKNVTELNTQQKAVTKLALVPCEDKFPDCHYIKDAHKAKETIGVQTTLVQKLSVGLNDCKEMLEQYVSRKLREQISAYKDSNVKILMSASEIARIEDKIEHDNKNIEVVKRDLKDLETRLKGLKKSIDLVDSDDFNKKKQQMDSVVSDLSELNLKKNEFLIGLGGKQDFLSITMAEQTQGKDLIRKLKLYDSIQSAFSKNGIPAMVLKNQLPAINIEMAKVLDGLIDFTVSLETDTSSNVMDVFLEDTNSRRQVELCSGMEKTICSLALRVALGNLSSLPRPDIFILDESFSALDEDNLQKAMELLSLFRGYFKSVLVISHQTQIKEISDMIIEIKNNGIESKVEQ